MLRRRARRRLVGAVALALAAVVVLPMVFDPEPRPLGDKVDIRIPEQDTPFQPAPAVEPQASAPAAPASDVAVQPEPAPVVESVAPAAKPQAAVAAKPEARKPEPRKPEPKPAAVTKASPVAKPEPVRAASHAVPAGKPEPVGKSEPVGKPEAKPAPIVQPETKPEPAGDAAAKDDVKPAVSAGYYLQLGVFSSQANANLMIAKAKAAGFKSSAVPVGGQYKVRVGPIPQRDKALDYQAKLKARGLDNVLVEP